MSSMHAQFASKGDSPGDNDTKMVSICYHLKLLLIHHLLGKHEGNMWQIFRGFKIDDMWLKL